MRIRINTEIIKSLNPCQDRLDNYLQHYPEFDGDVKKFFKLKHITHQDKLWVVLRLVDHDTRVIFAIDCSFSAYAVANAAYVANAAGAYAVDVAYANTTYTTYAAYAADVAGAAAIAAGAYAAARKQEEQARQIESFLYLIGG
jgi:hypothetical protein